MPISEEANQLGEVLGELLFPETIERGRGRPKDRKGRLDAILAFVADILETNQRGYDRQVYRSLNVHSFTGETIGYRAFSEAVRASESAALVSRLKGYWKRERLRRRSCRVWEGCAMAGYGC